MFLTISAASRVSRPPLTMRFLTISAASLVSRSRLDKTVSHYIRCITCVTASPDNSPRRAASFHIQIQLYGSPTTKISQALAALLWANFRVQRSGHKAVLKRAYILLIIVSCCKV